MVSDNIYVFPNTCDNIFVINPNKVVNEFGNPEDRYIKQENLIYYANLECELEPRSRLLTGTDKSTVTTISLASMNFLNPKGFGEFTTDWTGIQDTTVNQNQISSQLLGMKSISYRVGMSYIPTVTITLEDVKGRALFESGDNSPYSAFFNLPYPTFYLTLKGYYGKAVRYPLILQKFTSSFNSSNGNFDINLTMIGYKFNVLTDITMAELFAVPQMYVKRTPTSQNQNTGNQTNTVTQAITQKGYQTIQQVYKDYKNLGLIDKDFPELTVQQLSTKLDNFITFSLSQFGQANLRPLNDIDTYSKDLDVYRGQIYSYTSSFFNLNLDQTNYFVTKPINNVRYKIYTWKLSNFQTFDTVVLEKLNLQFSKLNSIIVQNNLNLTNNQTFGNGEFKIENPIRTDSVVIDFENAIDLIDFVETAKERNTTGYTTPAQVTSISDELNDANDKFGETNLPFLFLFDGPNRFLTQSYELNKILESKKTTIEENLTTELSNFIKDASGLGFVPTVRNIVAVIMASAEAFLRLLQDVHENAWLARNSEIKKLANNDSPLSSSPVYPWPQYFVEKNVNGQTKFEIQYPGDTSVISTTKGNDYTIWPEVEFVEEFLKGYLQREIPPNPALDNNSGVNRVLVSSFDTISTNTPYSIKEDVLFLYEIWERIQTICSNNGFQRDNTEQTNQNVINYISDIESLNVFQSLISGNKENAPSLIFRFKTTDYTQQNYFQELQTALVNFTKYSQGIFVTQYLDDKINLNQNQIYDRDLEVIQIKPEKEKNFTNYIESNVHNDINFVDTYPFTFENWNYTNLAGGNSYFKFTEVNKTQKSIFYNNLIKKVTNFTEASVFGNNGNKKTLRPVVTYKWLTNKINLPIDLQNFYNSRTINEFVTTEGNLNYVDSTFTNKQTTSILNTPFFVNSLQLGITNYVDSGTGGYPFKAAAYLLLNGLPFSTLRERYLSFENNADVESDFIFAGLKKFGAIHRLPKYWILKLGSIWNRYKTYVESNVDILDTVWSDFNYIDNYDPINGDSATTYVLTATTFGQVSFVLGSNQTSNQNINVGFYPKLINDFYRLYNSEYVYEPTVTSTNEIQVAFQNALDEGRVILLHGNNTDINKPSINLKTWTVCIKAENQDFYYVCPSFGSIDNQTKKECFDNSDNNTISVLNNPSVHNGAIRLFWAAPNYGYFNTTNLVKPSTIEYFKKVNSEQKQQTTFEILNEDGYSSIEDIFSVFDFDELEIFEKEFLSFCSPNNSDNLQNLFKNLMKIDVLSSAFAGSINTNELIKSLSLNQQNNFKNYINSKLGFDVLYKKSNPLGFDKNLFNILSSNPSPEIVNRYQIRNYETTPDSVPTNGVITYQDSLANNPTQWKTMKLYVGFSTIDGLNYDATSNYLTDFFREFNIGFTVDNIKTFRKLIKIYGANAIRGGSNPVEFKNRVSNFISNYSDLSGKTFTNFITLLQKKLGVNEPNPQTIDSVLEGFQSKVELYDMFKAINDKWIAGNDYIKTDNNSDAPLFRDYLFLDRGNRNVGDIYVDIAKVNSYLKGANPKSNVFTVVGSIIKDHNFVSFLIPSYINFYGRQTPSGDIDLESNETAPNEFANNLFGTFDTVDYQSSKPKMLNVYVDKPSQQLDNKNKTNGYKDDGLDISVCAENPIAISSDQKRNYSLENRVVGFAVDFELQNQGVFKSISVSQDLGKATSESLMAEYNLGQSSTGIQTSTQNVSLYNIYKTRSYNASVTSMGNVMIQPSMYFVLRNIPLFAGSYFITEVQHTIGLDEFSTNFTGTRQAAPTLPKVDSLFQTIKKQLLTNLGNTYKNQGSTGVGTTGNVSQIKNAITNSLVGPKILNASIECTKNEAYINYVKFTGGNETVSAIVVAQSIKLLLPTSNKTKICIFASIWVESGIEGEIPQLSYYGNNMAGITLDYDYPGNLKGFFLTDQNKNYFQCLTNTNNYTQSYAVFANQILHHTFMIAAYKNYFDKVTNITDADVFANEFARIWIEFFPYNKVIQTPTIFDDYRTGNVNEYQSLINKIKRAFEIYRGIPI